MTPEVRFFGIQSSESANQAFAFPVNNHFVVRSGEFSRGQEGTGSLGQREFLVPRLVSAIIHHFGSLNYELSSEIAIIQGRMGNPTTTLDSRDADYT
jgi:hypothetical protein